MIKYLLVGLSASLLLLTGCSTTIKTVEKVGNARVEMSCLTLDDSLTDIALESAHQTILNKYGFETETQMNEVVSMVNGTSYQNKLRVLVRAKLLEECGDQLENADISVDDLVDAVVSLD